MPTWQDILVELKNAQTQKVANPFDAVRRQYLKKLHAETGRNVILYASAFTQGKPALPGSLSVTEEDVQGLMQVVNDLPATGTDLIVHSPGGSVEAAEMMVEYLHTQYPHIRVFVPQLAMSAATMIACGSHEIVMGKHSALGPTDPQFFIPAAGRFCPAHAIIEQYEATIKEAAKPGHEAAIAILQMYGPSLVAECRDLIALSRTIVAGWLKKWMLPSMGKKLGAKKLGQKAGLIARFLANRKKFLSHGRHILRDQAKKLGLNVTDLKENRTTQDLVLSVFHATTHTFNGTNAVKLIENHLGRAFIKLAGVQTHTIPIPMQAPSP